MALRWPRLVPLLAVLHLPFIGGGLLTDDFAHAAHLSSLDSPARLLDAPDAFGFYRPLTQATLAVTPGARDRRPAQARAFNVALHAIVIALALVVARLVLQSTAAAGLATLAFALTPKAPSIAVLWISARGELLMAICSLASIAAWIVWTRRGQGAWLALSLVSYGLALLSKETATLLPLLLLLTPRSERSFGSRTSAVAGFVALALVIYTWRAQTGALTPFSSNEHYSPAISLGVWLRNAVNYTGRMIAAPMALVGLLGLARLTDSRPRMPLGSYSILVPLDVLACAAAFVVIFLAPVLPIALRSELYLYLPVFGVCLFAGWLASLISGDIGRRSLIALMLFIVGLGGYQAGRSLSINRDLIFSEKLVAALQASAAIAQSAGSVRLVPANPTTSRFLSDAIGDYFYVVLPFATGNNQITGVIDYGRRGAPAEGVRIDCDYRDGTVVISRAESTARSPF